MSATQRLCQPLQRCPWARDFLTIASSVIAKPPPGVQRQAQCSPSAVAHTWDKPCARSTAPGERGEGPYAPVPEAHVVPDRPMALFCRPHVSPTSVHLQWLCGPTMGASLLPRSSHDPWPSSQNCGFCRISPSKGVPCRPTPWHLGLAAAPTAAAGGREAVVGGPGPASIKSAVGRWGGGGGQSRPTE